MTTPASGFGSVGVVRAFLADGPNTIAVPCTEGVCISISMERCCRIMSFNSAIFATSVTSEKCWPKHAADELSDDGGHLLISSWAGTFSLLRVSSEWAGRLPTAEPRPWGATFTAGAPLGADTVAPAGEPAPCSPPLSCRVKQHRAHPRPAVRQAAGDPRVVSDGSQANVGAHSGHLRLGRRGEHGGRVARHHSLQLERVARRDCKDGQLKPEGLFPWSLRRRRRQVGREQAGGLAVVKVLRDGSAGEGVARCDARRGAGARRQLQVLLHLRRGKVIRLGRHERKLTQHAPLEQLATQRRRHQRLGALVVDCARDGRDNEQRVGLLQDGPHHTVARGVVVV
eukprot:scaffold8224_cov118-Isochrysis_galbana.AAC.10